MKEPKRKTEQAAYGQIDRRELFSRWLPPVVAGVFLGGTGIALSDRPGRHAPPDVSQLAGLRDWRISSDTPLELVVASGQGPKQNLNRALAAMGGIERFVHPGDRVAIKPNCAWDRTPEQAANTDPELVGELTRLCMAAGAASVVVVDSTCHDAGRAFERSGIGPAARAAGAKIAHQNSADLVQLELGGTRLGAWDVLRPIAEADRVINVPVVKHHSLTGATLGMKNWFGALVGRRSQLHQRIHQVCAELGVAFRPTLTVVDATRILTANGPTGGSLSVVRKPDQIAVATDPVAADAWGGSLLERGTSDLPHLEIAARLGLGSADWKAMAEVV
jgi:uncharacterized protein (DUF362 family)